MDNVLGQHLGLGFTKPRVVTDEAVPGVGERWDGPVGTPKPHRQRHQARTGMTRAVRVPFGYCVEESPSARRHITLPLLMLLKTLRLPS